MDGGDWVLFAALAACGALAYWAVDRFGAGRIWVPHLEGSLKIVGRLGLIVGGAGFAGIVLWGLADLPPKGEPPRSIDQDLGPPGWAVAAIVAFALGAVLVSTAIVLGRRRVPSGHPDARAHRARRSQATD